MAGWTCKQCEVVRTFRRPPHNICSGCRTTKRGKHNCKRQKLKEKKVEAAHVNSSRPNVRVREKTSPTKPVSKSPRYMSMKEALKKECEENLVPVLGLTDAYLAAAQAMSVVDRYEQEKLPLPACHRSLVSFAMAMSPIADEDLKRTLYIKHVTPKISVEQMRAGECMWAMTLPFNRKHTEPS